MTCTDLTRVARTACDVHKLAALVADDADHQLCSCKPPQHLHPGSIQPKMARTTLALLLASRAAALVPTLRTTSISKTISRVSYLSEVEDADKKKKWWDQDDEGREESNPRDHTGVGEADSNYGPTNYEGFIDADGFDGGDGQVGVVGDGKNHMEEFDMSAEDSRGLKGGRKLNQMGGRESKLNAKNAWGTTTGYADELAKRGMVEIDEYGEDKLARRRQQLENWRNQEELRMKKDHQMAKRGVGTSSCASICDAARWMRSCPSLS